jgi:NUC153 domain
VNKDLVKDLLESSGKGSKAAVSGEEAVDRLMKDDRFKRLFTDKEFQIDQNADAYQRVKPSSAAKKLRQDNVDSVKSGGSDAEDDIPVKSVKDLNKLFSGKGEQSSDEGEDAGHNSDEEDDNFQSKMNKK